MTVIRHIIITVYNNDSDSDRYLQAALLQPVAVVPPLLAQNDPRKVRRARLRPATRRHPARNAFALNSFLMRCTEPVLVK